MAADLSARLADDDDDCDLDDDDLELTQQL